MAWWLIALRRHAGSLLNKEVYMATIGFFVLVGGWIWSVARGIQVSMLCVVLNFIFPPLAQGIFSLYEPPIRAPLMTMVVGTALMYFAGALRFADSGLGFSFNL
jgi:hypothetical protein